MSPWQAGVQLGPYVLVSPIGSGGMGEVWKARDTRLDREVAIKRLSAQHSARFEQEARAIAALNHPNICTLYDIGPDYLVMEYIEGAAVKGPQPAAEAVKLATQIAEALVEAHGRGVLHRDLKPANILVTAKGSVKLLDFGLAKLTANSDATQTLAGAIMGTPLYMSPEQAEGKPADERSDVFSFGAVLYEVVSGRRAFDSLAAVLRDDPKPPPALAETVMRCLRKAPAERFQSMAEVRVALGGQAEDLPDVPSIAVLPFANMSADKDNEYFSDGLAEEIINALAHFPGLNVTARTSAFAFRGKEQDIRKIAETLDVRTVLEGSVRRSGNRIRVTAQLVNAANGYHLWSERYDREMADVFAMQDEIAQAIAKALRLKLAVAPRRHIPNVPAYEAYLKALHYSRQISPERVARSTEFFERAISLDPEFALAHSELANFFGNQTIAGVMPAREGLPLARAAARRAVEIDPSLPEGHGMLGMVAALYDYDWKEAERCFRLAMAHDPVPPSVRCAYAFFFLRPMGRAREAVEEHRRALKEDPLHLGYRIQLAVSLLADGREEEALAECRQILELDEGFIPALFTFGLYYALKGRLKEALVVAEKNHAAASWNLQAIGLLAGALVRSGDTARVPGLLARLLPGEAYGVARALAVFHLLCSETDQAAVWVAKAIEQRDPMISILLRHPVTEALRSSPHWPALAKMMNLPEAVS